GEARDKNQIQEVPLTHLGGLLRSDQIALNGLVRYPFWIDTTTIIGNLNIDLPSFMKGTQKKRACLVLTRFATRFWRLNTVIDRIPHQVGQGGLDGLEQRPVQFGLLSVHADLDLFPTLQRQVADYPREFIPECINGLHAGLHDAFLECHGDQIQTLIRREDASFFLFCTELHNPITDENQLTDLVHQRVEQSHIDSDASVGDTC